MSEAKHAAAPWAFEAEETSSGPMFSVYDSCGQRLTEPYIDEQKARLIAVAPELSGIVSEMLRSAEDYTWQSDRDWFVDKARECLAKAGGRS